MRQGWKPLEPAFYDDDDKTCRWCGGPFTSGRQKRFCSTDCQYQFNVRHHSGTLKIFVHKRDDWTCALCNVRHYWNKTLMQADHIVPISDGGEEFEPENVRTLCRDCHKKVTSEWRKEKALRN